jgi:hypothetical protein
LKPLLHTWSLSIEEQFYLVWPVLCALVAASCGLRWVSRLAWALGAASLVAWMALVHSQNGSSAFFLTPFRVWELMLGAGLALACGRPAIGPRKAEAMAGLGALLIVAAVCAPLRSHWLGDYMALPACLGALLLIASGSHRQTAVARVLSTSPMVGIGLISYSLYLWHWPLLSFARYHFDRPLQWEEVAVILALTLAAAVITYRFVERPLRRMTWFAPRRVVATGIACLAAFALAGFRMEKDRGWALNLHPEIRQLDAIARTTNIYQSKCFKQGSALGNDEACTFGHPRQSGSFDLVIFGDSHANHYTPAISVLAREAGMSGRQVTIGACLALLGDFVVESPFGSRARCPSLREAMVRFVEENPRLRLVVLAQSWSIYAGTELIAKEGRRVVHLLRSKGDERSQQRSSEILRRSLEETLDFFEKRGIAVLLLGEVPPLARDPVICMANAIKRGSPPNACGRDHAEVSRVIGATDALLADLARTRRNVFFFSPSEVMCDQTWCNAIVGGTYMYRDMTHLNRFGAERLAQTMRLPDRLLHAEGQ